MPTFARHLCSLISGLVLTCAASIAVEPNSLTKGLQNDIRFLSSDDLRGRSAIDEETIDVARDYLAERMQQIGLEMESADGTPFQPVEMTIGSEIKSVEGNVAEFEIADAETVRAELDKGFGPLSVGKDQATVSGPVVFAGYGITSEKYNYDDYASIDATGAIVMVLRKEPGASDPDSPFDGTRNTRNAYFQTKIANAIKQGAAAVLIINDPASVRDAEAQVRNRIKQEEQRIKGLQEQLDNLPKEAVKNRAATEQKIATVKDLIAATQVELESAKRGVLEIEAAGRKNRVTSKVPVASIARDLADQLLIASGCDSLETLESRIDETYEPASCMLSGMTGKIQVDLKASVAVSDNVIGRLPGKGTLADETLVIGAHYDHVGMGGRASLAPGTVAVHNGADDNASGTAAMLACAAALKDRLAGAEQQHRSILFIGFTGEERGLLGSKHYVQNPVTPIEKTAAMINLDMVGRLSDNELTIYGTGTAPRLEGLVDKANESGGFTLFKVPSGYGPSDHESFYRAGVPVLFFFTGLHNDYHRPTDDFDKIDFGDLTRVTDMVCDVAYQLAVLPERPVYAETRPGAAITRQMTAFLGVRVRQQSGQVMITEVTPDGPASKAGLATNDVLEKINKKEIRTTNDVLSWVRNHSAGDEFVLSIKRQSQPMTLRGKLEKRTN